MNPLKINLLNFESSVLQSDVPVLLVFGAVWDEDSRLLFYQLDEFAEKLDGKLKTGIVDLDYVPDIFYDYEVYDIPTMMIFEDGVPFESKIGYRDSRDMEDFLFYFFGYLPFPRREYPKK